MPLDIITIPCLDDNYAYLLRDEATGQVALVDAPDAAPIEKALDDRGWTLDQILITHHHNDHIAGVDDLRSRYGARVVGAAADSGRLPALDLALSEGDTVSVGENTATVLDVPGHTVGHIAYYFPDSAALFSADSLMIMGCGRLFEGSAEQMWSSLSKMIALPPETEIYSGHEYAEANTRFALSVTPDDPALRERAAAIAQLRKEGKPTVPARLDLEMASNPFLRAANPDFRAALGLQDRSDAEVFADLRHRKDTF